MPEDDEDAEARNDADKEPGDWEAGEKHLICPMVWEDEKNPEDSENAGTKEDDKERGGGMSAATKSSRADIHDTASEIEGVHDLHPFEAPFDDFRVGVEEREEFASA